MIDENKLLKEIKNQIKIIGTFGFIKHLNTLKPKMK